MAATSLRGGKNIYGINTLCGNWAEERWNPKHEARGLKDLYQLPTKSIKNWGKTSAAYGSAMREEMTKKLARPAPPPPPTEYETTQRRVFSEPSQRELPCEKPKHTEEWLAAYRAQWTNGEPHQYK